MSSSPRGIVVAAALGLLAAGCAGKKDPDVEAMREAVMGTASPSPEADLRNTQAPTDGPKNVLLNPGFEQGALGWHWLEGNSNWGPFEIVDFPVRSGEKAARLVVDWPLHAPGQAVKVYGIIQEPKDQPFPDRLSGYYRVDAWDRGDPLTKLYLQVVVIVWGDPRIRKLVGVAEDSPLNNYQIRYYLAGLKQIAFRLSNAKLVFVKRGEPELGAWIRFDIPLKEDWMRLWGVVPEGYESIRVLFEARWDQKPAGKPVHAEITYDDLFFGYE